MQVQCKNNTIKGFSKKFDVENNNSSNNKNHVSEQSSDVSVDMDNFKYPDTKTETLEFIENVSIYRLDAAEIKTPGYFQIRILFAHLCHSLPNRPNLQIQIKHYYHCTFTHKPNCINLFFKSNYGTNKFSVGPQTVIQ